tara:strand:+ start:1365 stop:1898 length:534 start_codon:yes stop_codon:yes gene_type:complete
MSQDKLPFKTIPGAPDNITTGTSLARMTQGIGFRYYWATESLSAEDLKYRPSEEAQSMLETIKHIYGLSNMIFNAASGKENIRPLTDIPQDYANLRKVTLSFLEDASLLFLNASKEELTLMKVKFNRDGNRSSYPIWNLINGPLSDVLYHTGQIVSFRRTSGNPIAKGVNVFMGAKN